MRRTFVVFLKNPAIYWARILMYAYAPSRPMEEREKGERGESPRGRVRSCSLISPLWMIAGTLCSR